MNKKISLNFAAHGFSQLITIVYQMALIPFYLSKWGTALYADWLVLTGAISMLVLLDFGVAQTSASKATISFARGNVAEAQRAVHTAILFTVMLALCICILALIGCSYLDVQGILSLKVITSDQAKRIFFVMSCYLAIQLLGGPLEAVYRVKGEAATGAFLIANRRTIDIITTILVLYLDGGVAELAIYLFLAQFSYLSIIVFLIFCFDNSDQLMGFNCAAWNEFFSILRPAIGYLCFPVAQIFSLQGSIQLLNLYASSSELVVFNMTRTFMRLLIQVGVLANNSLKPELSRMIGRGEDREALRSITKISRSIIMLCLFLFALQVVFGPKFIAYWSRGAVVGTAYFCFLIGLHALINVLWYVDAALRMAKNEHTGLAKIYMFSTLFAIFVWIAIGGGINPVIAASMTLVFPEIVVFIYSKVFNA